MLKIKNLKSIVTKYLRITAAVMTVIITIVASGMLFLFEQQSMRRATDSVFSQVERLFEEGLDNRNETSGLTNAQIVQQIMIRINSGMDLYIFDNTTGEILGTTVSQNDGLTASDLGISLEKCADKPNGFHTTVDGVYSFCIFKAVDNVFVGRVISFEEMYSDVITLSIVLMLGIILTAMILVNVVSYFINKKVIIEIDKVNSKLSDISSGNLDERVNVRSCVEFSELSEHINDMIAALLSSTNKISVILDKADLQVGVYEYNQKMKTVRFTEKITKILGIREDEVDRITSDCDLFHEYLKARIFDKVSEEENIYRLYGDTEKYIKQEEFMSDNSILGVIMDITEDYRRRKLLEIERDTDALTGLLNRRGLDNRLDTLFKNPAKLGFGALVMLDADGLKQINDELGHEAGDVYLKSIAAQLKSLGARTAICARQGGDEFVVFFHNLESRDDVDRQLKRLDEIRENITVTVSDGKTVNIRYSFGVSILDGSGNYHELLKQADERMYASKRQRKERTSSY